MSKKYDEDKLKEKGILEFDTEFYRLDESKSHAWINLPFTAIRQTNWNKNTLLNVKIKEVKQKEK